MIHPYAYNPNFKRVLRLEKKSGLIKYSVAGFFIWFSDFAVFFILYNNRHLDLAVATGAAYAVGIAVSFLLSRYWVFRRDVRGMGAATNLFRYGFMLVFNLFLTYLMLRGLATFFAIEPIIGKLYVAFFMYFWSYITNKLWVFKGSASTKKTRKKPAHRKRVIKKRYA